MKNKTILIIVCVVLGIVLVGGATYFVADNLLNKNKTNETLTDNDVEEYLKYVPFQYKDNAYEHESINVNEIDKLALLGMVLDKEMGSYNDVDKLLKKMYNISLDSIKLENSDKLLETPTGSCYSYNNKVFGVDDCVGGMLKISIIEDYKVNNDELIITEYAARDEKVGLIDMYSDYTTDYIDGDTAEYFKQNKDEFTTYEHTFKKNDTGYYWYSTKVVKSGKINSIALSDEELMKYVSYVPVQEHITDDFYSGPNAYKANSDNVTQIDKIALVLQILVNIEYPSYDKRNATFEEVEKYLHEMYNVDMKSVDLDPFYVYPGLTGQDGKWYYIENGVFDGNGDNLGDIGAPIHVIEKYDFENDELHIYERNSKCDGFPYPVMTDHNKGVVKDFENEFYEAIENNTDADISCEKYLENNKDKFTLYKDTFKKNDTGYYWYSTEVVK